MDFSLQTALGMHHRSTIVTAAAFVGLISLTGCADEIDVYENATEEASPLIGSWEWPVQVSHLDVDADLNAIQTSDFDSPGSSPSSYAMRPESDGVLALEGWLANAPCAIDTACDEGRAYQRHHMSYHVDDEHFFPFALVRMSGSPGVVGGAGAGVFEGFGVEETRLAELTAAGEATFRAIETRWRLSLDPEGGWTSSMERLALDGDAAIEESGARGSWTLAADGTLTLVDADGGATKQTLWKGDVIALDGLVFERLE